MRKVSIAFLLKSSSVHAERGLPSFLSFRSLVTRPIEYAFTNAETGEDAVSTTGSESRKVPEKKKAPRSKTGKHGCSAQDLRSAERSSPPQILIVKAKARAKVAAEDSTHVAATKKAASSAHVVATKTATKHAEIRVLETGIHGPGAETRTMYESATLGKRKELAMCAKASVNTHSVQEEFTEIIGKLDLSSYTHGNRWEKVARKLLDYGISLADVLVILRKCRTVRCSTLWVDSTLEHCEQLGMSCQQMGRLFSRWPSILNVRDDTFKRKIEFFESIGIDRYRLGNSVDVMVRTITMSLPNLRQKAAFWKDYMEGIRANSFCDMLTKNPELLTYSLPTQKLAWLEVQGFDKKWLVTQSSILKISLPVLISKAQLLEGFGISDARKRAWILIFISGFSIPTLQARFENLLSAGFSRDQVQDIVTKTPLVFSYTEDHVNIRINYLLNVINASFEAILSSPGVWSHNFERRLKYRYEVIKRLQSLGVLKQGVSLGYMVCMTNANFNRKYVEKLEDVVKQVDALSA